MEEKNKINIWLKLIYGAARYVLGALILASGPLTLIFLHKDPLAMAHAIVHPMLTFFVTPQILIGLYFMVTAKWRGRIDFTLFLIAAILILIFSSFAQGFGA